MVSYYSPAGMYRHQQQISAPNGHFQANSPMHSWYAGYHQTPQLGGAPSASYCVQEEQQMWHHHPAHSHSVFQHDFQDFVHTGIPPLQHPQHHIDPENQLPSPPITVSGSEMSSPGGQSGNISPQENHTQNTRPPPARSPYEWIKKTSYQSQPNPGKTRTKDKYRVVYTDHQRVELEKEFYYGRYITIRRKAELAANLGLSERQVKIWFQNRRAKERKHVKKREEVPHKSSLDLNLQLLPEQHLQQHQQAQDQALLPVSALI